MPKKQSNSAASAPPPSQVDDQKRELATAIEKAEKLGESELEIARLFLANGRPEVARRRLQLIVEHYSASAAASEARQHLEAITRAAPSRPSRRA